MPKRTIYNNKNQTLFYWSFLETFSCLLAIDNIFFSFRELVPTSFGKCNLIWKAEKLIYHHEICRELVSPFRSNWNAQNAEVNFFHCKHVAFRRHLLVYWINVPIVSISQKQMLRFFVTLVSIVNENSDIWTNKSSFLEFSSTSQICLLLSYLDFGWNLSKSTRWPKYLNCFFWLRELNLHNNRYFMKIFLSIQ